MPRSVFSKQYSIFRKKLVEARRSAGLTQRALADRLGYPQSYVSKYESGERRIDLIEFLQLAKMLKIDIPTFIAAVQQANVDAEEGNDAQN